MRTMNYENQLYINSMNNENQLYISSDMKQINTQVLTEVSHAVFSLVKGRNHSG